MQYLPINLIDKFSKFSDTWSPRIITQINNYHFKPAKTQGEFIWHDHPGTDEVFVVVKGHLDILFHDGRVSMSEGEMFVVPKGVEHKPVAKEECHITLIEPAGAVNTCDVDSALTRRDQLWI